MTQQQAQGVAAAQNQHHVLHYQGEFRDDMRDGRGMLTVETNNQAEPELRFEGEFKDDKRHGKVDEMTALRESDQVRVTFQGSLNEKQMMSGLGHL